MLAAYLYKPDALAEWAQNQYNLNFLKAKSKWETLIKIIRKEIPFQVEPL